ncbi:GNAT family N-acetyltransferase [Clavibacter sp. Sh2141]|uniref:GNAT family N-acetyltransferase n=1 Tax=Clavibacter sp. Sh2141 TaxID=3395374 RepID=UPI0039BC4F63
MRGIEVRALAALEVERLEREEPPGRGFVRARRAAQEAGGSVLLVAWDGDRPLGSGQLDVRGAVPELRNLQVEEAARGRGVGTAIIREAERRIGPGGRLTMGVGLDNTRARALYERLGYRGTGETTTTSYAYVDDAGATRQATETDETLARDLA